MLQEHGRIEMAKPVSSWRRDLLDAGLLEYALDGEIGLIAADLSDLHRAPADRFIAATAIVHQATLITADERLLAWRHPLQRHNARA